MRKGILPALALTLPLFAAGQLKASVAYTNLAPGDSFKPQSVWPISGATSAEFGSLYTFAMPFTAATSGDLSSIEIAVEHLSGLNSFTVSLLADNSHAPGSSLESFSLTNAYAGPNNNPYPLDTITSVAHPILVMGTEYWVEVAPSDSSSTAYAGWNQNSTGATDTFFYNSGGTSHTLNGSLGAFAVNVTASVPEPSSLAIGFVVSFVGMSLGARRRRQI